MALMHRYVHDYTNAHDLTVCDEIMHPDYRIQIGGQSLDLTEYKNMVGWAYERFPDLRLVVHEFVTNGTRLAMHFSETATSQAHDGRRAVWHGIGLYRMAEDGRLAECLVEQDFYGRRGQFAGDAEKAVPVESPAVWSTAAATSSPGSEAVVREWLLTGDTEGGPRTGVVVQDGGRPRPLLSDRSTVVDDMFSAGDRVAFRATVHGRYVGGLHGADDATDARQHLDIVGLATVDSGTVNHVALVTDRYGLRVRLRAG